MIFVLFGKGADGSTYFLRLLEADGYIGVEMWYGFNERLGIKIVLGRK
jgi:hypothetical protein